MNSVSYDWANTMLDMLMDTNETSDSTQDQTLNHWVISYVQW